MRLPERCPHRKLSAQKGASATCEVLRNLIDAKGDICGEVTTNQCTACCRHFEPSVGEMNPYVASMLFAAARAILEKGGVEGCSAEKAVELKALARANLSVLNFPGKGLRKNEAYDGNCIFLGKQTGERECPSCNGSVRRRVFRCDHSLHSQTTIWDCTHCVDYETRLKRGHPGKFDWATGVTAAPRKQATLERSLDSLANAGWPEAHLFVEPETELPQNYPASQVTRRAVQLGAWPNFFVSLVELIMLHPEADAYFMCQDDALYCKGLRTYLEQTLWPAEHVGVVSLYTAKHHDRGDVEGFYSADVGWGAWGAQAYIFANAAARALVAHPRVVNHRNRGPRNGLCNVDSVVGRWCRDSGLPYFFHTPSLTQHIGETSTLWEKATLGGRRQAVTFVGEDVDIAGFMSKIDAGS